jgi:hypothetical protein
MKKAAKYAAFDFRDDYRTEISYTITASKVSAAKVRRWKEAARFAPPTATTEHMPFKGHRTCAEWR